jgi:pseudouridine-5'-phosphate glycosidase
MVSGKINFMENKRGLFNFGKKPAPDFRISDDVERAKRNGKPLVALESALITHGVPWPENLTIARAMEDAVKHNGAFPATIAVQEGQLRVGLSSSQLESLAESRDPHKLSLRDLGAALAR